MNVNVPATNCETARHKTDPLTHAQSNWLKLILKVSFSNPGRWRPFFHKKRELLALLFITEKSSWKLACKKNILRQCKVMPLPKFDWGKFFSWISTTVARKKIYYLANQYQKKPHLFTCISIIISSINRHLWKIEIDKLPIFTSVFPLLVTALKVLPFGCTFQKSILK